MVKQVLLCPCGIRMKQEESKMRTTRSIVNTMGRFTLRKTTCIILKINAILPQLPTNRIVSAGIMNVNGTKSYKVLKQGQPSH